MRAIIRLSAHFAAAIRHGPSGRAVLRAAGSRFVRSPAFNTRQQGLRGFCASAYRPAQAEKHTNRLVHEKSPYLLQHAHNPVDWYPWGKEAFDKAVAENKPIFLSVGYSTCHWCHVMEHESFQNEETAKFMNENFVNIKVDREENPGVDKLYMTYIQLSTGRGGWPMSVFLTPELTPFFAGTYFPPGDQFGTPGFRTLLQRVAELWEAAPDKLREEGNNTIAQLQNYVDAKPAASTGLASLVPDRVISDAYNHFDTSFDPEYGGFTGAPKFPTPVQLRFLLEYYGYMRSNKDLVENANAALDMVLLTLKRMASGGIHDHIGGGFHRYSTDKYWHVPHFEKMLYDQGQLLSIYSVAYQITKDQQYANVVEDIIKYVAGNLRDKQGGFYSAEDADSLPDFKSSKKKEGAFYVWRAGELDIILGPEDARVFGCHYGVRDEGNVNPAIDPHGELTNQNVLAEQQSFEATAKELGMAPSEVSRILESARRKLREHQLKQRPLPHRDDKILTSWNGLMISGLAQAYQAFQNPNILDLATGAADFIHEQLYKPDTKILLRSYCSGPSAIEGFLDDYSYLVQGLLDLYESTLDEKWIKWAYDLQEKQNELFYDKNKGGYFNVQENDKSILVRLKDEQDGAEPSANAVSLRNLVRLGTLLEQEKYVNMARDTVTSFSAVISKFPYATPALVSSFLLMANGVKQIVLAGNRADERFKEFEKIVSQAFVPNKIVAYAKKDGFVAANNATVARIANTSNGRPAAYICENFTCGLPIQDAANLRKQIGQ